MQEAGVRGAADETWRYLTIEVAPEKSARTR